MPTVARLSQIEIDPDDVISVIDELARIRREEGEPEDGEAMYVVLRIFADTKDRQYTFALHERLRSMAALIQAENIESWAWPGENGAIAIREQVLAATASCPLVDFDERIGFERDEFVRHIFRSGRH